jgi:NAD(P)-dependent dehydrogenase (short-subunit alcohol dehydrogenase family)
VSAAAESALVTGGASGLGAAAARRLHAGGRHVVLVDLDGPAGPAIATELGSRAAFVPADVRDEAAVQAGVDAAVRAAPLRAAILCAGIAPAGRVLGRDGPLPLEAFARVVDVNLVGSFNCLRLAARAMEANDPDDQGQRGVVVLTASIAAWEGQIGQVAYAAAKAGVAGMTLAAARDLAGRGIRVVAVAPGVMDTPMMAGLPESVREPLAASVPNPPRFGRPDEFAALVAHVLANPYLNGEVIRLDGALRMPPR